MESEYSELFKTSGITMVLFVFGSHWVISNLFLKYKLEPFPTLPLISVVLGTYKLTTVSADPLKLTKDPFKSIAPFDKSCDSKIVFSGK